MCGRFTLRQSRQEIARAFDLLSLPDLVPRYNIAPTQDVAVVRAASDDPSAAGPRQRQLASLHWGLIPSWADDPASAKGTINARSETIDSRPLFRQSFRHRRCLVVADGFFEWKKAGSRKQPYYIRLASGQLFGMAGIWDCWQRAGQTIESCAIITTGANAQVSQLHDRMPAIIDPAAYGQWLDPAIQDPEQLKPLLGPYVAQPMQLTPVRPSLVNSPQYDGPECTEDFRPERALELFPDDS